MSPKADTRITPEHLGGCGNGSGNDKYKARFVKTLIVACLSCPRVLADSEQKTRSVYEKLGMNHILAADSGRETRESYRDGSSTSNWEGG